jgi:hypothetical protein
MSNVIVSTNHHWFDDIHLVVNDNNKTWIRNGVPIKNDENDLQNTLNDLFYSFSLTGISPEELEINGGAIDDVYELIYNTSISKLSVFEINQCSCSKEFCNAPIDLDLHHDKTTYEELFSLFGIKTKSDLLKRGYYYEYPATLLLKLDVPKVVPKIHDNYCCNNDLIESGIELDDNKTYISFTFVR